uniref:MCG15924 putative n=1 Tax=Albugo laibachii Nc14 TaxID=890382 RepID=F0W6W5_9STRA|nr:mCG15924 putative [Albugo laibachii Nc14]|eukprot:CCA16860.1 mCG15924 putative [Albugo laibachii Nc14]
MSVFEMNGIDELLQQLKSSSKNDSTPDSSLRTEYLISTSSVSVAECYLQSPDQEIKASNFKVANIPQACSEFERSKLLNETLKHVIAHEMHPSKGDTKGNMFLFASVDDINCSTLPPSRTLPQLPIPTSTWGLRPCVSNLVDSPFDLQYEYRILKPAEDSNQFTSNCKSRASLVEKYTRGQNGKTRKKNMSSYVKKADDINDERHQRELDAIALGIEPDKYELQEEMESFVITAPGLSGCLKFEDVSKLLILTQTGEVAGRKNNSKSDKMPEQIMVGIARNDDKMLGPYKEIASDSSRLDTFHRKVNEEKQRQIIQGREFSSSVSTTQPTSSVRLADLLDTDDGYEDEEATKSLNADDTEPQATSQPLKEEQPDISTDDEELGDLVSPGSMLRLSGDQKRPQTKDWAVLSDVSVSNFHSKVSRPAISYPFELDTFQKRCIIHLENHENVFVAAHTSAGKTVIAEYAIALSQKHMTRSVYTSPIKALSNQKYRDFREKFGVDQVGLITGDVSINPEASCLIMTTEILRSMLYLGADMIRDIEWVIFDEIHYINDSERGAVWEEVIIMLPYHVGMVFLSATTPNHLEFSDWIGRIKQKKIHVVSTLHRPIPLQHHIYTNKKFFKILDGEHAKEGFNLKEYKAAQGLLRGETPNDNKQKDAKRSNRGGQPSRSVHSSRASSGDSSDWTKFINVLQTKSLLPAVVFAFSKRVCQESAEKLRNFDFCANSTERSQIHVFLEHSIKQRLQGSDRELPQVLSIKSMLQRGIGIHHGGLLPILKELVEILFARGLVRVLFATETFAMGVNMPARTVVFNGIHKHDGKVYRELLPGEYTQMAGRAGRRGLDTVGTVVIPCWQEANLPDLSLLQSMLTGSALRLTSQFRLTSNMILSLLRVEALTVEDMMKRSFSEFRTQKHLANQEIPLKIQKLQRRKLHLVENLEKDYPDLKNSGTLEDLRDYHELQCAKEEVEKELLESLLMSKDSRIVRSAFCRGRVVLVNVHGLPRHHAALILNVEEGSGTAVGGDDTSNKLLLTIACLCSEAYNVPQLDNAETNRIGAVQGKRRSNMDEDLSSMMRGSKTKEPSKPLKSNVTGTIMGSKYAILNVPATCVSVLTSTDATGIDFRALTASSSARELGACIQFLIEFLSNLNTSDDLGNTPPFLDSLRDLGCNDLEVANIQARWKQLDHRIQTHALTLFCQEATSHTKKLQVTRKAQALQVIRKTAAIERACGQLKLMLSSDSLSLFPDFQQRLRVLKRLGYLSSDLVVQLKGRVACEISSCDELQLTEMIFENVLAELEPEEIVAVLSALIFQEKSQHTPTLTERLENAREQMELIADSLEVIQLEQQVAVDRKNTTEKPLNFGLVEVVYEWSRGMPFKSICELTDIPEGSIVRSITRLQELCRKVRNAARIIGDPILYRKMEIASETIKRDVVFAASLYI